MIRFEESERFNKPSICFSIVAMLEVAIEEEIGFGSLRAAGGSCRRARKKNRPLPNKIRMKIRTQVVWRDMTRIIKD